MKIKNSNTLLVLIGNHWPSRTIGELQTEPYRLAAADALSYFHKRILEEYGEDTPIIVMGDFNDMPFNRSLMDYAFSIPYKEQVAKSKLDQFMVSKSIAFEKMISVKKDSVWDK